jgi:Icc-related predicted phosphoesterase
MRLRGRGARAERHRVLFVTDLHSSEITFRKVLNAVGVYEATTLIVGGDLTGKQLVPIVQGPDGWRTKVLGDECAGHDQDDLAPLLARIRDLGQYPAILSESEYEAYSADPVAVDERFVEACHAQVRDWMERLGDRFADANIPVYVTGGNDDYFSIESILSDAPWVINAEGKAVELIPGLMMISTGYGNPTPWQCPRDIPEEELLQRIEAMAELLTDPAQAIFNMHVPPVASGLDTCMRLDVSVSPPRPISGEETEAGSTAVRAAIEQYQPLLSLHGHIHECRGVRPIGRTTCANPGSEYAEGVLHSVVIDFTGNELHNVQLAAA